MNEVNNVAVAWEVGDDDAFVWIGGDILFLPFIFLSGNAYVFRMYR